MIRVHLTWAYQFRIQDTADPQACAAAGRHGRREPDRSSLNLPNAGIYYFSFASSAIPFQIGMSDANLIKRFRCREWHKHWMLRDVTTLATSRLEQLQRRHYSKANFFPLGERSPEREAQCRRKIDQTVVTVGDIVPVYPSDGETRPRRIDVEKWLQLKIQREYELHPGEIGDTGPDFNRGRCEDLEVTFEDKRGRNLVDLYPEWSGKPA